MQQNIERSKFIIGSIFVSLLIVLLSSFTQYKTPYQYEIRKDAKEYTHAAYYLRTKGSISQDGVNPSQFREPLTIAVLAVHMALFTDIPTGLSDLNVITQSTHYIKQINMVNLWYIIPSLFVMWWLAYRLTRSHIYASILIFTAWTTFYIQPWYLARPLTEYATSLFILIICAIALKTFDSQSTKKRLLYCLTTGISIGLLALIKAVALYVGLVFAPLLSFLLYQAYTISAKYMVIYTLIILTGLAVVVTPWMMRNASLTDNVSIAARGGSILLGRAKLNETISPDVIGGLYVYAPPKLQRSLFEQHLGFEQKSLWGDGKYAPLNRKVAYIRDPNRSAIRSIDTSHDKQSYKRAFNQIEHHILDHLKTTAVMAWRGLWSFDGGNHLRPSGESVFSITMNLISFLTFLIMPLLALILRRKILFIFSLFPLGMFWVYALFSHFIPRYSAPLIPIAILSLLVLVQHLLTLRTKKQFSSLH